MSDVTVTVANHVAEVVLDRPARHNSLTMTMFEELAVAGERIADDPSVRAVVLTGAGGSFCSGLDTAHFGPRTDDAGEVGPRVRRLLTEPAYEPDPGHAGNLGQHAVQVWSALPVPVVAAVRGHALGAGIQLAAAADIRVCSPDASFGALEIRWGLVPDLGGIPLLIGLVGRSFTAELTYTGRTFTADEAARRGFVTDVVDDPLAVAHALAATIAARNPEAVRQAKRLVREAPPWPTAASLADEGHVLVHLEHSPNQLEAVAAQRERRSPVFEDPRPYP